VPPPLIEPTDVQLMARIQHGDPDAFRVLYDRFGARAYRVAFAIARDASRAEDVVQEAFLSTWRHCALYRPERGSPQAWVLGIVRNRALDALRHHGRHDSRRVGAEQLDDRVWDAPSVEHLVARLDEAERLRHVLAQLPDPQREVIALAYYGQLSAAEIAGALALPLGTVKGRMRLGLMKLRAQGTAYAPC